MAGEKIDPGAGAAGVPGVPPPPPPGVNPTLPELTKAEFSTWAPPAAQLEAMGARNEAVFASSEQMLGDLSGATPPVAEVVMTGEHSEAPATFDMQPPRPSEADTPPTPALDAALEVAQAEVSPGLSEALWGKKADAGGVTLHAEKMTAENTSPQEFDAAIDQIGAKADEIERRAAELDATSPGDAANLRSEAGLMRQSARDLNTERQKLTPESTQSDSPSPEDQPPTVEVKPAMQVEAGTANPEEPADVAEPEPSEPERPTDEPSPEHAAPDTIEAPTEDPSVAEKARLDAEEARGEAARDQVLDSINAKNPAAKEIIAMAKSDQYIADVVDNTAEELRSHGVKEETIAQKTAELQAKLETQRELTPDSKNASEYADFWENVAAHKPIEKPAETIPVPEEPATPEQTPAETGPTPEQLAEQQALDESAQKGNEARDQIMPGKPEVADAKADAYIEKNVADTVAEKAKDFEQSLRDAGMTDEAFIKTKVGEFSTKASAAERDKLKANMELLDGNANGAEYEQFWNQVKDFDPSAGVEKEPVVERLKFLEPSAKEVQESVLLKYNSGELSGPQLQQLIDRGLVLDKEGKVDLGLTDPAITKELADAIYDKKFTEHQVRLEILNPDAKGNADLLLEAPEAKEHKLDPELAKHLEEGREAWDKVAAVLETSGIFATARAGNPDFDLTDSPLSLVFTKDGKPYYSGADRRTITMSDGNEVEIDVSTPESVKLTNEAMLGALGKYETEVAELNATNLENALRRIDIKPETSDKDKAGMIYNGILKKVGGDYYVDPDMVFALAVGIAEDKVAKGGGDLNKIIDQTHTDLRDLIYTTSKSGGGKVDAGLEQKPTQDIINALQSGANGKYAGWFDSAERIGISPKQTKMSDIAFALAGNDPSLASDAFDRLEADLSYDLAFTQKLYASYQSRTGDTRTYEQFEELFKDEMVPILGREFYAYEIGQQTSGITQKSPNDVRENYIALRNEFRQKMIADAELLSNTDRTKFEAIYGGLVDYGRIQTVQDIVAEAAEAKANLLARRPHPNASHINLDTLSPEEVKYAERHIDNVLAKKMGNRIAYMLDEGHDALDVNSKDDAVWLALETEPQNETEITRTKTAMADFKAKRDAWEQKYAEINKIEDVDQRRTELEALGQYELGPSNPDFIELTRIREERLRTIQNVRSAAAENNQFILQAKQNYLNLDGKTLTGASPLQDRSVTTSQDSRIANNVITAEVDSGSTLDTLAKNRARFAALAALGSPLTNFDSGAIDGVNPKEMMLSNMSRRIGDSQRGVLTALRTNSKIPRDTTGLGVSLRRSYFDRTDPLQDQPLVVSKRMNILAVGPREYVRLRKLEGNRV